MVGGYKGKSYCPFFPVKSENKANKLFLFLPSDILKITQREEKGSRV